MKAMRILILLLGMVLLLIPSVFAADGVSFKITASGGGIYDYVIIGMAPGATDGLDYVYDVFTPGYGLNDSYIYAFIPHPEWGAVKADFRDDIRSMKNHDEWTIGITSNLPAGTPMTLQLEAEGAGKGVKVEAIDADSGVAANLIKSAVAFSAPGDGVVKYFTVTLDLKLRSR